VLLLVLNLLLGYSLSVLLKIWRFIMGNRVLMQCFSSKTGEFGPVVYCHWAGDTAPEIVNRLAAQMKGREGDLAYSSARLVQCAIGTDAHNTGFGMWNAEKLLTAADSHGDAGCVLIDVDKDHKAQYFGGYLT
jgi:hypothetical protein